MFQNDHNGHSGRNRHNDLVEIMNIIGIIDLKRKRYNLFSTHPQPQPCALCVGYGGSKKNGTENQTETDLLESEPDRGTGTRIVFHDY